MVAILVVEDEPLLRSILTADLSDCGYSVLQAGNYQQSICTLLERPDIGLVLTDIDLGNGPSGLDLGEWLLANRPAMRLMFMSGQITAAQMVAKLCKAATFFSKPFDTLTVLAAIEGHLGRR